MQSRLSIHGIGLLLFLTLLGCDSGSDSRDPVSPPMPMVNSASATFKLSGAGYDETVGLDSDSNTVFCRRNAGWADLWVRFSEDGFGDGSGGRHIDLDLCNYTMGGSFVAHDPEAASCGATPSWDIWWHDGTTTFLNRPGGSCTLNLQLEEQGTMLVGSFQCLGLRELGGDRSLDILDGFFECVVE